MLFKSRICIYHTNPCSNVKIKLHLILIVENINNGRTFYFDIDEFGGFSNTLISFYKDYKRARDAYGFRLIGHVIQKGCEQPKGRRRGMDIFTFSRYYPDYNKKDRKQVKSAPSQNY